MFGSARLLGSLGAALAGYLVGTAPTADLVTKLAGSQVDLRRDGTGNPGAANTAALLGPKFGFVVLIGDIAKGAVAGIVGRRIAGNNGAHVAASASVIGHCLPVWSGFRGGKGVTTSVGQVLVTFPAYFPIDAAVAVATAAFPKWKQRAFTATTTASIVWIAASTLWWRRGWSNLWGPKPTAALPVSAAVSSAVIMWRFVTAAPTPTAGDDK